MRNTRRFTVSYIALATFIALAIHPSWGADGPNSAAKEQELIAILSSSAPAAEKALACKHLAIYGSAAAVPELSRLLTNEQLASWARIALEVIPGKAADEALRKATESLQGRLLVGTINSIGVRRNADSVVPLTARLQDQNAEVASAAAVALGRIGNPAATKSLRAALKVVPAGVRSAAAEGCVLCAERCLSEGRDAEAAEIYDEVRKADVPKQRILEATRGAILARKQEGIPILVEQLRSSDKGLFQISLMTAREFPAGQMDEALAAELVRAVPDRAALILVAMADRKESVLVPAVLKAAGSGPKQVRLAAVGALGRVGDAACLSSLLEMALDADPELAQAAKSALAELPDRNIDKEIVARLSTGEGKTYPLLIELVGNRRIEASATLLKALDHSDPTVRHAVLKSLGATVTAKNLAALLDQVVSPKHAEDEAVAQQALKVASVRMPDREACAVEIASALERSPVPTKVALLQILGAVGGTKALSTVGAAAKSTDPQLQDISSRLLGEWMTIDAAPVLLDLAKTAPGDKYQVRALRGYIRIARQFVMPEPQRAEMCAKAFEAARYVAEQKLVLEVLKRYPTMQMLKLAIQAAQTPELKEDATQTALAIAQKVGGNQATAQQLLGKIGLDRIKVEIVKAEYGAGSTRKDVTEVLRLQVDDLPLITLASGSYNAAFGGDPAPGIVKQLTVQYRINGKPGEASFAENATILLPVPK